MKIKNNQPLVSILMNCYNGENYLAEAIESIIFQTYSNWELIFWDTFNSRTIGCCAPRQNVEYSKN